MSPYTAVPFTHLVLLEPTIGCPFHCYWFRSKAIAKPISSKGGVPRGVQFHGRASPIQRLQWMSACGYSFLPMDSVAEDLYLRKNGRAKLAVSGTIRTFRRSGWTLLIP